MATEDDHLAQLRASLDAVGAQAGDPASLRQAVEVLLKVAIAHHEQTVASVEATPAFMETGEPIQTPGLGDAAR